jgi:DNA-binding NarL/FixJ family response regulator
MQKLILIVEDEGLIAADLQKRLERFGYPEPVIANSGPEAVQCARAMPFDLVLMDIGLEGELDGIATAGILKAEREMAVVYLTAFSDRNTVNRGKLTEPYGYLVKPIDDGTLRSTVVISIHRHEAELRKRPVQPKGGSVPLTAREREIVQLVAEGHTAKEIAHTIHVAAKTVEFHKYNAMRKTSARSTADLTRFALRAGIVHP